MRYPTTIEVEGVSIPINANFKVGIEFEGIMLDRHLEPIDKLIKALELYFIGLPENIDVEKVIGALLDFYTMGKKSESRQEARSRKQAYDFIEDWPYIHAGFLEQYGMDLNTIEYLHWWEFRGLLESLNDKTQFKKIVGYRVMEIDSKMSKEQKKFYNEMKRIYRLPDKRSQEEIDEEFANAFF